MSFAELGLIDTLVDAVKQQGYDQPSPIQAKAIPLILQGKDVMAAAQTGTGKTAGFVLPILQHLANKSVATPKKGNRVRALVLTPTRELAAQIDANISAYSVNQQVRSTVVFGGVKINPQMQRLRGGVGLLVATPGRLLDLANQNALTLEHLEILVLDEADRMLDMGFIHDIKKIIKLLPRKRQTLMFSATFSNEIRDLARGLMHKPAEVSVTPANTTVDAVSQLVIPVEKSDKTAALAHLIKQQDWYQVLVFSRTKHGANRLVSKLIKRDIEAAAIHGNKSQGARTRALQEFKDGKVRVLVATDIAARGIDISQLPQVVNFDLPSVPEDYVHRIGRTGRAGESGSAISLVSHDEFKQLQAIESLIGKILPRDALPEFPPLNNLPESTLKVQKPKRPKKKKPSNKQQATGSDRKTSDAKRSQTNQKRRGKPSSKARSQGQAADGDRRKSTAKTKSRRNRKPSRRQDSSKPSLG